ncbi:MAG: GGDEF domain-containing protein [Spirochaetales bacterium]|nr:GGDEF domain-containing protein [Spirochaetales bacterium]
MRPAGIYRKLLDELHDGVYFVDRDRRITHWNAAAERISGFSAKEVVGSFCHDNLLQHMDPTGARLCIDGCPLSRTMNDGNPKVVETVYLHHREGHRVPIQVRTLPIFGSGGTVTGAVEIFSKLDRRGSDLERRLSELRRRLMLDTLTQLPNREHAQRDLGTRLYDFQHGGTAFGAIFADIDHFKNINDTYGHAAGDKVLKVIAATLANNIRPGDMIARWGGEEFVGAFASLGSAGLQVVAGKLLMLVRGSRVDLTDEKPLQQVTISIGATVANLSDTVETLVERADELMYKSKTAGRDRATLG